MQKSHSWLPHIFVLQEHRKCWLKKTLQTAQCKAGTKNSTGMTVGGMRLWSSTMQHSGEGKEACTIVKLHDNIQCLGLLKDVALLHTQRRLREQPPSDMELDPTGRRHAWKTNTGVYISTMNCGGGRKGQTSQLLLLLQWEGENLIIVWRLHQQSLSYFETNMTDGWASGVLNRTFKCLLRKFGRKE